MKRYLFHAAAVFFAVFTTALKAQDAADSVQTGKLKAGLQKIESWFDNFDEYVKRTDVITPGELQKLPVGLRTTIGNTDYDILVTQAQFAPDNTQISVYLRIAGPDWEGKQRKLYFGADDILISKNGGFIGDIKLALAGDVTVKSKSDHFHVTFLGRGDMDKELKSADGMPPTYAVVNCEGFKELQISGVLHLTGDEVVFIEKDGTPTVESVRINFFCNAKNVDDILVKVDIPEFTLKQLPEWSFKAQDVMLDLSQTRNCPGFEPYDKNVPDAQWQGLYIDDITLHFPDYIKKADGSRPYVKAKKFYIDERGCTGVFEAGDVLRLDEGSLGGWGFSIKKFWFDIKQNRLAGGGFNGGIEIPVSTANAYDYAVNINADGTWNTQLKLDKMAKFDFINGKELKLYADSYLKVEKKKNKDVLVEANLSGQFKLNPTAGEKDNFGMGNFTFRGMKIRSQSPYFEVSSIKWDDEIKFGNFPISISDLEIHGREEDISLGFKSKISLGDKSDGNFGGSLGMKVKSAVETENGKQKWKFKGVELDQIRLDVDNSYFKFAGGVQFMRNHKIYGNGFKGDLDFVIKPLGDMRLAADLILGNTGTYKYWYFDMMANFGATGIPVFPGFKIAGFGGGAYKHMSMLSFGENNYNPGEFGDFSDLGQTRSGVYYEPDPDKSLGLKAAVVLAMQEEKCFNAELIFEMLFNKNGGVSSIGFTGIGKFLTGELGAFADFSKKVSNIASKLQPDLEQQRKAASADGSITAKVNLTMDFNNKCFTGILDTYLDLGIIKGEGKDGYMGRAGMFFGSDRWYVKIGEPAQPLGLKLKVGAVQASAKSYFMTGSHLPDFPGLPDKLATLLDRRYPNPDPSDLKKGAGLAFGSKLSVSTGTVPLLLFYGQFDADLGFDIMLKKYSHTLCKETGNAPGINNWYAQGQAYSYLMSDIGLYLKLFGKKRNFSVMRGEGACMLRAALPNPSSFSGNLAVSVSLLNGLVKGDFNLGFDLGTSCDMVNQGFADGMGIIAGTLPEENDKADVFSVPQAAFNFPVETEMDVDFERENKKLKITLDQYELWHGGTKLKGELEYDNNRRVVKFKPRDILPANTQIDFKLAVGAKEKNKESWSALKDDEGKNYTEERIYSFKTGNVPDSIPWSNVKYCYPVKDQKYFLPRESRTCFVVLERGMADLFTDKDYRKRVVLVSGKDSLSAAFTYNQSKNRLQWTLPKDLKQSTRYELLIVLQYTGNDAALVGNNATGGSTSTVNETVLHNDESGNLSQQTVSLTKNDYRSDKDKVVLRYTFTTSRYPSFAQKLAAVKLKTMRTPLIYKSPLNTYYVNDPDVHYLQAEMNTAEGFCDNEFRGTRYSGRSPLVIPKADLSEERYFIDDINPYIYAGYPFGGTVKYEREPGQTLIPDWAVYGSVFFSENDKTYFPWIYCLPVQYKADYNAMLGGIANNSTSTLSPYYFLFSKNFTPIRNGAYPVILQYVLPDGTVTSSQKVIFNNQ